jgi:RimJ/RimL family protein N-acetyltransferase
VLSGSTFTLREMRLKDAASMLAMLTTQEVSRFISQPPANVTGFERFITWANRERQAGNYACFAVVPHGMDNAVGLFQLRSRESGFGMAEWGFALGAPFWGTGIFLEGAGLLMDFAFGIVGARRLEARSMVTNGRGNGGLRKVGAVREGVLRRSFLHGGEYHDQALWGIVEQDWRLRRRSQEPLSIRH